MKKQIPFLSLLAFLTGCATIEHTDPRVKIDPAVGRKICVSGATAVPTEAGYRNFRATIHNDYASERAVEWRVIWLDEDQVELEMAASGWNKIMVPASGSVTVKSTATRPEARDFRFHLRKLKEL